MTARVIDDPRRLRRSCPDWATAALPSATKALGKAFSRYGQPRAERPRQMWREPLPPCLSAVKALGKVVAALPVVGEAAKAIAKSSEATLLVTAQIWR
ncbi:hypothetical protein NL676_021488 [Syzygium grande]|nr:hypothetical protein NL676_021488 [Syzygium grande]